MDLCEFCSLKGKKFTYLAPLLSVLKIENTRNSRKTYIPKTKFPSNETLCSMKIAVVTRVHSHATRAVHFYYCAIFITREIEELFKESCCGRNGVRVVLRPSVYNLRRVLHCERRYSDWLSGISARLCSLRLRPCSRKKTALNVICIN